MLAGNSGAASANFDANTSVTQEGLNAALRQMPKTEGDEYLNELLSTNDKYHNVFRTATSNLAQMVEEVVWIAMDVRGRRGGRLEVAKPVGAARAPPSLGARAIEALRTVAGRQLHLAHRRLTRVEYT